MTHIPAPVPVLGDHHDDVCGLRGHLPRHLVWKTHRRGESAKSFAPPSPVDKILNTFNSMKHDFFLICPRSSLDVAEVSWARCVPSVGSSASPSPSPLLSTTSTTSMKSLKLRRRSRLKRPRHLGRMWTEVNLGSFFYNCSSFTGLTPFIC